MQATGIKHDSDKPDMSLLSSIAMVKVAEVMSFGKKKYAAHNWRGGFAWSRPAAAALRHIFAWLGGENKDPETGLSHLAHASCCLMFLLEFESTRVELDDRFKISERPQALPDFSADELSPGNYYFDDGVLKRMDD